MTLMNVVTAGAIAIGVAWCRSTRPERRKESS